MICDMGHKDKKDIIEKGKFLCLVLRHKPEEIDLKIDKHGWANVNELLTKAKFISLDELNEIVETNNKKRFEFNDDKSLIRACQGHSIDVEMNYKPQTPPDILYHGTASRFLDSIFKNGILKGNRQYVHLSLNKEIALDVGKRHGKPVILLVDSKQMFEDGIEFYCSNNGVWLTDYVDKKYFKLI